MERKLSWSAVLAGAVLIAAISWVGELFGGLISMIEPQRASAWPYVGALVGVALAAVGGLAGGFLAARLCPQDTRGETILHGLLAWSVFAVISGLSFSILGGNVALVTGATEGEIRLGFGASAIGLIAAAVFAGAGASAVAPRRGLVRTRTDREDRGRHRVMPGRREVSTSAPQQREVTVENAETGAERTETYRKGESFGGDKPPSSVH